MEFVTNSGYYTGSDYEDKKREANAGGTLAFAPLAKTSCYFFLPCLPHISRVMCGPGLALAYL